ncbi:hypothetical protein BGX26_001660 [Mortierella sp. AD094]|nr:hypothetical protein BGX26_001660 [Mortierella sp. AD094]
MHSPHRSHCCFCIPFRFAVAILSLLSLAIGGLGLWFVLKTGFTDSSYRIPAYVATGIYCLIGVSGLCAVIFKKYALAKNFSVLWWTVTVVVSILSIINIILLATRGKEETMDNCKANLLLYDDKYIAGKYDPADLAADVDTCANFLLIAAGAGFAIQFIVMSIGGWVASMYTSEVKHQKEGLVYTYGQGYGPVHPQPQPHPHQHSPAHPCTKVSPAHPCTKVSPAHPYTNLGAKTILLSTSLFIQTVVATGPRNANTVQENIAAISAPSESQANVFDPQVVLTSQEVHANDADEDFNPQQTASTNQIIDTDTYGGHTPDATYPISDHDGSSSLPVGPTSEVDPDIRKMAEGMTLRELAGQMTQIQIGMLLDKHGELDMSKVQYWIGEWDVGSFLDTPTNHGGAYLAYSAKRFSKIVNDIQKVALSAGKGVPMIYGLDSVHGANYVDGAILFPQQIGLAATFNTTHAYESGRITAKDTRAAGIPWVFSPILDIAVHKLWPRVYETFGEDPYVASEMGSATIRGLQGNYKKDRTRVAACMKHFIGYSASRNGQDKSSAWIPDNYLMDYFVPSFQAAVQAGVATAMETYIDVNGQPVVGSHFYLTELLRHRIGFKGMLVSDWQELDRLYTEHRTTSSLKDAAQTCLKQTSLDMVMVPESESFSKDAMALVQEGEIDRQRLVESVAKVLQLKKDVGLFDQPMSDPKLLSYVGSKQDITAAKNAARESITVLKNKDSILPLKSKRILVTGPAANSIRALSGGWSIKWQGAEDDEWYQDRGETIMDGIYSEFGSDSASGSGDAFLTAIEDADTVILCLGEKPYAEIVGNINNLDLPWGQLDVIRKVTEKVKGTNTKVVLVLVEGRPRGLQDLADRVDAIVMAYLPGPWGGHPIAEILSGSVNPSGRLPMTYPSGPGDMNTNYYRSGVDPYKPLFTFGEGLSYSTVEYQNLKLSNDLLHTKTYEDGSSKNSQESDDVDGIDGTNGEAGDGKKSKQRKFKAPGSTIVAKISVHNKSNRPVKETVFWYITQDYRSDVMPEAFLLKGFQKVSLDAGETKEVEFTVTRDALAYHGRSLRKKVEKGKFTLTVNAMRPEAQSVKFEVV